MAANGERQRKQAMELAKYEGECRKFKTTVHNIAMLVSIGLALLVAGTLVPSKNLYLLPEAMLSFLRTAVLSIWLSIKKFPQRPDVQARLGGQDRPDVENQLGGGGRR